MFRNLFIVLFASILGACDLGTYDLPEYEIMGQEDTGDVDIDDTDSIDDGCEGYLLEVVGSGEYDMGWQCLPVRPYYDMAGSEYFQTSTEVLNMTWSIEIQASPEAEIQMDVIVLEFDAFYKESIWFERVYNETERWTAVTDDGTPLFISPQLGSDGWMAVVILEQNVGWDPAVVVGASEQRSIVVTLDTSDLEFSPGDSMTGSFDNYQTWESQDAGLPRISTAHEEFPILGTTYEIVDSSF